MVPQNMILFGDNVSKNLKWGHWGEPYSDMTETWRETCIRISYEHEDSHL